MALDPEERAQLDRIESMLVKLTARHDEVIMPEVGLTTVREGHLNLTPTEDQLRKRTRERT